MNERFLCLNLLTIYGPNNVNRDESGLPKTIMMGGAKRARISSQARKRAIRVSNECRPVMTGLRSKMHGDKIVDHLLAKQLCTDAEARGLAFAIMSKIGKTVFNPKDKKSVQIEQLIFLSQDEANHLNTIAEMVISGEIAKKPLPVAKPAKAKSKAKDAVEDDGAEEAEASEASEEKKPANPLTPNYTIDYDVMGALAAFKSSVDQAMFGRMVAEHPDHSIEAAAQFSHAVTANAASIESDFMTACDDLSDASSSGSAHIGEVALTSGVYHSYVCIDTHLLERNLGGNRVLAKEAIGRTIRAAMTVSPRGMASSTAAHNLATYALLERTDKTPRSLSDAFYTPVAGGRVEAVRALQKRRDQQNRVFGMLDPNMVEMDIENDASATVEDIIAYARS